ncbi:MAG: M48 family metalloprotease [Pseudomonadota bacterium]
MTAKSTARLIDALALIIFVVILGIAIPVLWTFNPVVAWVALLAPLLWYLIVMIYHPLQQSHPADDPKLINLINDRRIRLRTSDTMPTRALDLIFWRAIVINNQDLTGFYQDWRALIGHELVHLKNRDSQYFHFVGVAGLMILIITFLMIVQFLTYLLLPKRVQQTLELNAAGTAIWASTVIVLACLFFIFWLRRSLHEREFLADQGGRAMNADAFDDWLRRGLRLERNANHQMIKLPDRLLKWFTHPNFSRRLKRIQSNSSEMSSDFFSNILRSIVFLWGSGILAYAVLVAGAEFFSGHPYERWLTVIYLALSALSVAAGTGAISVATLDALHKGGVSRGLAHVAAVGTVNWCAIAGLYSVTVALGHYEGLAADFPPQQTEGKSGGLPFLVILVNFSGCVLALNLIAQRFFKKFWYSAVFHLATGIISFLSAFIITKLQWAISL